MSDEQIIPAAQQPDPGTRDGAGERVERGLGSEGVQRMEGEFGSLEAVDDDDVEEDGDLPPA